MKTKEALYPKMEEWYVWEDRLRGRVYNLPRTLDGTPLVSSKITLLDIPRKKCQTGQRIYALGEPHKGMSVIIHRCITKTTRYEQNENDID